MWMRGVLTLVWTLLSGVALLLWDCASIVVRDPLAVCPAVAAIGIPQPLWVAWALFGVSMVGLIAVWAPYLRARRRLRKAQPERALLANINRLPDPYVDFEPDRDGPGPVVELKLAVEVLETAFATDSTATRAMTTEWMRLLLDANRMHNDGTLSTENFKDLNTRLLEAVTTPTAQGSSV